MATKTSNSEYVLEFKNISKRFPGVKALSDVSFGIKRGSVHVIVGENGAGKSTLLKVINGLYKADEGVVLLDGQPLHVSGPSEALKAGISMIYQELNIIPEMTVLENMYLGREPLRSGFINDKQMLKDARDFLDQQGLKYDLKQKMKNLSVADAQMIEIVKAISANAKIILMDEPTSSLTEKEVEYLFKKIEELKNHGITVVFISHKMDEIFRIGEYISVFRDGAHISTEPASETSIPEIIEKMVGRKMTEVYPQKTEPVGEDIVFEVKNFYKRGVFEDINFKLKRGEILGVSGLIGAGRTEIARAIMGMDSKDSGEVFLNGEKVDIRNVNDAVSAGISMVPEDRRRQGLVSILNVSENVSLVALKHKIKGFVLKNKPIRALVQRMVDLLSIKTPSLETQVLTLSGGNQQKVVLGKWLSVDPKVLILDEPTRGIDVGTKYEIYKLMLEMNKNGVSILMIDSDLEELLGMSDRVLVVYQGKIQGELKKEELSANSVMHLAVGGK